MPAPNTGNSRGPGPQEDPRIVAAQNAFTNALCAEPTPQDTERALEALKQHGTRAENGEVSFTGANGDSFKLTEEISSRVLTWSTPENFPTALLASGVTDAKRLEFLEDARKYLSREIESESKIAATAMALSELQSGRITADGLDAEGLLFFYQATMDRAFVPDRGWFDVTKHGNEFALTSNIDLTTGKIGETRYLFNENGTPVGDHSSADSSPVDALLSSTVTRTNTMIWSRKDSESPWEQNTHLRFTLGGNPIDFAQYGSGFSEGTAALLKAFDMRTLAVDAALKALKALTQAREEVETARLAAQRGAISFDGVTLPRHSPIDREALRSEVESEGRNEP